MEQQKAAFLKKYGKPQEERAACSAFVKKYWKEELAHRIRIANEVTQQIFLFDLSWDMEQTNEPVTWEQDMDWMYQPTDDLEFIFQLNRHRYWVCLGQAYIVTGDERYVQCFVNQLTDWAEKNPITDETRPKTWRTIEAGLRGENWIKAMSYMAECPLVTDEVFALFVEMLACHGAYLAANNTPFSIKSNWGVLESSGLYAIGKLLETVGRQTEGAAYAELASGQLARQIQVQVMDDGVHWEQSPMYHNEVLKCYLEVFRTAKLFDDALPQPVINRVQTMAYANLYWQKPDGSQPAGGDSDVTDIRDVLTACAAWFDNPVLKSGGYERLDYESVWDFGMEMAVRYEAIPVQFLNRTLTWLKDSGNWYLRSSWGSDADYLHVRCGGLGGGHGHFDKFHLDLVFHGEELLTDSGRYTYVDGVERRRLKGAKAHNSLTVDDSDYTRCLDSWDVEGLFPAVTGNCCQRGDYTLIECGHLGYIEKGIYAERRILAIKPGIYLIMDTCYGSSGDKETHTYEQHFHPAQGQSLSLTERGFILKGSRCQTEFICATEGVTVTEEPFGSSPHYNQMVAGRLVTFASKGRGITGIITVAVCQQCEDIKAVRVQKVPVQSPVNRRVLEDWEAEGVVVSLESRSYLVVNAHVETGAHCEYIGARGSFGLGRVMVTDERSMDPAPVVLKW